MSKSHVRFMYQQRRDNWRRKNADRVDILCKNEAASSYSKSQAAKRKKGESSLLNRLKKCTTENSDGIPCIFERAKYHDERAKDVALTREEALQEYPNAIFWEQYEYPHIWPHANLWVCCRMCRRFMPTNSIPYIYPEEARIKKWTIVHTQCRSRFYNIMFNVNLEREHTVEYPADNDGVVEVAVEDDGDVEVAVEDDGDCPNVMEIL